MTLCHVAQGKQLFVANVGDSRAVLAERTADGYAAIDLTQDQTPYRCCMDIVEEARISVNFRVWIRAASAQATAQCLCDPREQTDALDVVAHLARGHRSSARASHAQKASAQHVKLSHGDQRASHTVGPDIPPTMRAGALQYAPHRKDELARVKSHGARVLTLEQLDGLMVRGCIIPTPQSRMTLGRARQTLMMQFQRLVHDPRRSCQSQACIVARRNEACTDVVARPLDGPAEGVSTMSRKPSY